MSDAYSQSVSQPASGMQRSSLLPGVGCPCNVWSGLLGGGGGGGVPGSHILPVDDLPEVAHVVRAHVLVVQVVGVLPHVDACTAQHITLQHSTAHHSTAQHSTTGQNTAEHKQI
jgi:hypothetical protein